MDPRDELPAGRWRLHVWAEGGGKRRGVAPDRQNCATICKNDTHCAYLRRKYAQGVCVCVCVCLCVCGDSGKFDLHFMVFSDIACCGRPPYLCVQHDCTCGREIHPEKPDRLVHILDVMNRQQLIDRCIRLVAREASASELLCAHSPSHVAVYAGTREGVLPPEHEVMDCGGLGLACDTVFNKVC